MKFRNFKIANPKNVNILCSFFIIICSVLFVILKGPAFNLLKGVLVASLLLILFYPGSRIYHSTMVSLNTLQSLILLICVLSVILISIFPMGNTYLWNGEFPEHRNQYELITESFLEGHLDFDYGDEAIMSALENPYDPAQRGDLPHHWDHAFYKGHYYMYFGVVPVFLLFMPYRLMTGQPLTTYHATQVFVSVFILGVFSLFFILSKRFFKKIPFVVYLLFSSAASLASVFYSISAPALYCTAITSALALQIWSLYFFVQAVFIKKKENIQILYAFIGAFLGALVFGCRPPIALANLLVLPMLITFLKEHRFSCKLLGKLFLAALPYFIVGAGLMLYNYMRFEDPFEFGQHYQLTVADQRNLSFTLTIDNFIKMYNSILESIFLVAPLEKFFPFVYPAGVFYNFPVLLFGFLLFSKNVSVILKKEGLFSLAWWLVIAVIVIIGLQAVTAPYLLERYHMDIYFLLYILSFLMLGIRLHICESSHKNKFSFLTVILCTISIINCYFFYIRITMDWYAPV